MNNKHENMRNIILLSLFFALSSINLLFSQDASLIYKNTVNSTVTILTDDGQGSGFFVAPNIIATNYHVVEGATNASCILNNSDIEYKIDGYVGVDESVDLILLKVSTLNKPAIKFSVTTASIGQKVYVIGSPRGLPATISDGIISGMRDFDGIKLLQMTAPISPGSSGGPVLNSNGELIGISVLQRTDGQNLNFAIPKSYLQILLDFKKNTPMALSSLISSEKPKKEISQEKPKKDSPNSYSSSIIGNQVWMTQNLNVDKFRNGDAIPQAKTCYEWLAANANKKPAWCYYASNPANGTKYGKLYNWYALKDVRGLAPSGYHIPSYAEVMTLQNNLGGQKVAGRKLKSTSGWDRSKNWHQANGEWTQKSTAVFDGNGNNSSGFSGLPGGYSSATYCGQKSLHVTPGFYSIGESVYWWCSTETTAGGEWIFSLHNLGDSFQVHFFHDPKDGFYVRCLRD